MKIWFYVAQKNALHTANTEQSNTYSWKKKVGGIDGKKSNHTLVFLVSRLISQNKTRKKM